MSMSERGLNLELIVSEDGRQANLNFFANVFDLSMDGAESKTGLPVKTLAKPDKPFAKPSVSSNNESARLSHSEVESGDESQKVLVEIKRFVDLVYESFLKNQSALVRVDTSEKFVEWRNSSGFQILYNSLEQADKISAVLEKMEYMSPDLQEVSNMLFSDEIARTIATLGGNIKDDSDWEEVKKAVSYFAGVFGEIANSNILKNIHVVNKKDDVKVVGFDVVEKQGLRNRIQTIIDTEESKSESPFGQGVRLGTLPYVMAGKRMAKIIGEDPHVAAFKEGYEKPVGKKSKAYKAAGQWVAKCLVELNNDPKGTLMRGVKEVKRWIQEPTFWTIRHELKKMNGFLGRDIGILQVDFINPLLEFIKKQEDISKSNTVFGKVLTIGHRLTLVTFPSELRSFMERKLRLNDICRVELPKLRAGLNNKHLTTEIRGRLTDVIREIEGFAGDFSLAYRQQDFYKSINNIEQLQTLVGLLKQYKANYEHALVELTGISQEMEKL